MAIDTLKGMRVYVDEKGEYHFTTHGASDLSALPQGWKFIGIMYPHMTEEGDTPVGWPQQKKIEDK